MKKLMKSEVGQGIVEFALALPLLLTILCGILDFGWIYSQKYQVEHAAFEGARYATINSKTASEADVINYVKSILPGTDVTVTSTSTEVKVTVKMEIPIFTFVASTFFGPTYDAVSTVTGAIYN
ncbi:MAG: pilus assembly protein [Lachnospiraceae bacterium]|nr:pilus assembly protein [Lachnospiraceae bacterium]